MRGLHHPNIVKFIEIFDEPAKLYIAMELAPGGWRRGVRVDRFRSVCLCGVAIRPTVGGSAGAGEGGTDLS